MGKKLISVKDTDKKTRELWSKIWETNALTNLPKITQCNSVADVSCPNIPAIIIGPGPSLQRSLKALAALEGRVLTICLQRALRPVQSFGITPNVVIALDSGEIAYEHLMQCDLSDITLCLDYSVYPPLFDLQARQILTYDGHSKELKWLYPMIETPVHVPSGFTVATAAVGLALVWKCSSVSLVGIDLSVKDDGGRYMTDEYNKGDLQVRAWKKGKILRSDIDLVLTRYKMMKYVEQYPSVSFFQCSEGGAFIKGFWHRKLSRLARIFRTHYDLRSMLTPTKKPDLEYLNKANLSDEMLEKLENARIDQYGKSLVKEASKIEQMVRMRGKNEYR